ncbi:hypothetical protein [Hazenella coriacea]|uniref:hypothetical protein n=1 Tax=Hazenella coriacea TaxID=1179467 RepID=UPI00104658AF|nr:hypothetical protein [Hazenella coriacea]
MNIKAASFACNLTGILGLLASLFLWKVSGTPAFFAGLIGSGVWFGLGYYFKRQTDTANKR